MELQGLSDYQHPNYDLGPPNAKRFAALLRRFADDIDAGHILFQKATASTTACRDDYTKSKLEIEYVDKRVKPMQQKAEGAD